MSRTSERAQASADPTTAAVLAELSHQSERLRSIEERIRDASARPAYERTFTAINGDGSAAAATFDLGIAGQLLCRAWQTGTSESAVYLFGGRMSLARCEALTPTGQLVVMDGVVSVPAGGMCEFVVDGLDAMTAYFEAAGTGNQGVTLRVTSLERPRAESRHRHGGSR